MADIFLRFEELQLCEICALSLPKSAGEEKICSRRCAGLRALSGKVLGAEQAAWRARILQELAGLQGDATICPGELSTRLLPNIEKPLTVFRPLLYQMAEEGRSILSQKGKKTPWWKIRGPFRIRKS